jgi:2-polyprenyl-3-methyl-5-hydroxy-6-metoxy-1,4-benzoquinol methylase
MIFVNLTRGYKVCEMTEQSGLIKKTLKRTIPLELRSYLTRRPSTGMDQATWDKEYAAGEWSKLGSLDEMPRYALVAGYIRTFSPAASVLDVGCGEGNLSRWLFESGNRPYMGVDVSRIAINEARARSSSEARFEVADAATFDPREQFDIIVLNEVLYYMAEPETVVERYEGFLKPGGVLIISMYRVAESICAWRRCASRLEVMHSVLLRGSNAAEWNVWLCRPRS